MADGLTSTAPIKDAAAAGHFSYLWFDNGVKDLKELQTRLGESSTKQAVEIFSHRDVDPFANQEIYQGIASNIRYSCSDPWFCLSGSRGLGFSEREEFFGTLASSLGDGKKDSDIDTAKNGGKLLAGLVHAFNQPAWNDLNDNGANLTSKICQYASPVARAAFVRTLTSQWDYNKDDIVRADEVLQSLKNDAPELYRQISEEPAGKWIAAHLAADRLQPSLVNMVNGAI